MAGRLVVITPSCGVVGPVVYIGHMHCHIVRTKYEYLNHGINRDFVCRISRLPFVYCPAMAPEWHSQFFLDVAMSDRCSRFSHHRPTLFQQTPLGRAPSDQRLRHTT